MEFNIQQIELGTNRINPTYRVILFWDGTIVCSVFTRPNHVDRVMYLRGADITK